MLHPVTIWRETRRSVFPIPLTRNIQHSHAWPVASGGYQNVNAIHRFTKQQDASGIESMYVSHRSFSHRAVVVLDSHRGRPGPVFHGRGTRNLKFSPHVSVAVRFSDPGSFLASFRLDSAHPGRRLQVTSGFLILYSVNWRIGSLLAPSPCVRAETWLRAAGTESDRTSEGGESVRARWIDIYPVATQQKVMC